MQYCHCIPWNMVRNDTKYDYQLCDSDGNNCFFETMENKYKKKECFCLSDCSFVKYSHFETTQPVDKSCNDPDQPENPDTFVLSKALVPMTNITDWKITKDGILKQYRQQLCIAQNKKDKLSVEVRME